MILKIKELRIARNLSQEELAKKIDVNQTAVSQWERGVVFPSCEKLMALSSALDCTTDELLGLVPLREFSA